MTALHFIAPICALLLLLVAAIALAIANTEPTFGDIDDVDLPDEPTSISELTRK